MVLPVEKTRESVVPVRSGVFISDETMIREDIAKEHQWLNKMQILIEKAKLDSEDYVSWAAYHASQQPDTNTTTSNVALLPLFRDNAHTTCIVKQHCNQTCHGRHQQGSEALKSNTDSCDCCRSTVVRHCKADTMVLSRNTWREQNRGHDGGLAHRDESTQVIGRLAPRKWMDNSAVAI